MKEDLNKHPYQQMIENEQFKKLKLDSNVSWDKDVDELVETMTDEMVKDIKLWRVGTGHEDPNTHSWRSIASEFAEKYSAYSDKHRILWGNQICGQQLCDAAMKRSNEKTEDGWN